MPTRAQLITGTFGLRLRQRRSNTSTITVYSIKVTVTYSQPGSSVNTQADVTLADPLGRVLETGMASGQITARIRKSGNGSNPQGRIEFRNACWHPPWTPIANTTITESDADGQILCGTFNQAIITDKTDVVARFVGTGAAGGLQS